MTLSPLLVACIETDVSGFKAEPAFDVGDPPVDSVPDVASRLVTGANVPHDVRIHEADGVTVRVADQGDTAVGRAVTVEVWSVDGLDLLAPAEVSAPPGAGVSRSILVEVPAARVAEGLRAHLSAAVAECGLFGNTDEWRDAPCL